MIGAIKNPCMERRVELDSGRITCAGRWRNGRGGGGRFGTETIAVCGSMAGALAKKLELTITLKLLKGRVRTHRIGACRYSLTTMEVSK
jgi:hypothetical protein